MSLQCFHSLTHLLDSVLTSNLFGKYRGKMPQTSPKSIDSKGGIPYAYAYFPASGQAGQPQQLINNPFI